MQKTSQSIPNHLGRSRCISLPQRFFCFANLERHGLVFGPITPCCCDQHLNDAWNAWNNQDEKILQDVRASASPAWLWLSEETAYIVITDM